MIKYTVNAATECHLTNREACKDMTLYLHLPDSLNLAQPQCQNDHLWPELGSRYAITVLRVVQLKMLQKEDSRAAAETNKLEEISVVKIRRGFLVFFNLSKISMCKF